MKLFLRRSKLKKFLERIFPCLTDYYANDYQDGYWVNLTYKNNTFGLKIDNDNNYLIKGVSGFTEKLIEMVIEKQKEIEILEQIIIKQKTKSSNNIKLLS